MKGFSFESDPDPVFSLDDFTNDCEPFFESEEDDLSSGENSPYAGRAIPSACMHKFVISPSNLYSGQRWSLRYLVCGRKENVRYVSKMSLCKH